MNAPDNKNRRMISGKRVICHASMELPKINHFNHVKTLRDGPMVFNVRGCAFYCLPQFTDRTIKDVFKGDEPGVIKEFRLYPKDGPAINLGNVSARFVRFTNSQKHVGMILRFVNLNERQIDTFFDLTNTLAEVEENEERQVSNILMQRKAI